MGLSGSGINEENNIVNGSWIARLIDDSIGDILSVPFCPYHFVSYHFVLEPFRTYVLYKIRYNNISRPVYDPHDPLRPPRPPCPKPGGCDPQSSRIDVPALNLFVSC